MKDIFLGLKVELHSSKPSSLGAPFLGLTQPSLQQMCLVYQLSCGSQQLESQT